MSEHEEEDVARVIRAVRTAYDDLQALRASRHSNIPSSLSNVDKTLDKLWCKLNILNGSPEALSVFFEYTVNVTSNSVVILLSGAIVNDMEATAKYLRNMMRVGLAGLPGDLHEQNCRKIQQTVDRYETIVSTVLSKHKESLLNCLTARSRETQETVEGISRRQAEQQETELADLRAKVYDRLKPVSSAYYDSSVAPSGCLEGTRVTIQTALVHWANDGAPELTTLWVNGMAGTGKTAIASTFASNMEDQGILGATFFVDRQQAERRDLRRIVQTLAYDLARHSHEQLRALWTVLRDDPALERLPYQEQMRLLIKNPLDVARPGKLVILIDGLDECGASNGASLLATLVKSLANHPMKLFVTSRNEAELVATLRDLPHTSIELQKIAVSGDVQLYWESNLNELCRANSLLDWRSMVSIAQLVELTGNLFIYATTILKIIQNTRTNPIKKLRDLLEISRAGSGYAIAFVGPINHGPLEMLYIHILAEAISDKDRNLRDDYADHLHDILEVVIFAREPLAPSVLSDLLDIDEDEVGAYLSSLSSVLVVPEASQPDGVIRPLHQSFPDFVRQQGGLVHAKLAMYPTVTEKHITERCMFQLNKHLHFDICDIKDASLFNHEVSDLPTRLKEHISAALRYSCRYWPSHLLEHIRVASYQIQVPDGLGAFCERHLLHWIEVLSLTEDMNAVQRLIRELISTMNRYPGWKEVGCLPLLDDARFFMRDYQFPINLSALQVYHSGVVSMPECTLGRRAITHNTARLISERNHNWQTETMILEGHTRWVSSVSFSSDGLRIVSGSGDDTVRIWDAVSGVVLHTLEGHTDRVFSVAFSLDGSRVVSGSGDDTLRVWDAISGAILHVLEGHIDSVFSVVFSSDGLHIVSGSSDCTLRIWNAVSGVPVQHLKGHTARVFSVACSFNGSRVVSGSDDKTVRIWDAVLCVVLRTLEGHTYSVCSIAFSSDGLRFVSGSYDGTVRIWDAMSGMIMYTLEGHTSSVYSVAFSSDGLRIVSGSDDRTVRIWDAVAGSVLHPLDGHTDIVNSVSFSSDGLRIVSGSGDHTVRIWDAISGVSLHIFKGHTDRVSLVAFSSDGSRIVSGSDDGRIRIWDAFSGMLVHHLEGHTDWVISVAFSLDGSRVVSGAADDTVRIWDAVSGTILHTLDGHTSSVYSLAFSSDGLRIVSGSHDNTVRIWDTVSGVTVHTLEGHTSYVNAVALSSDELHVVSGSGDGTVRVWDAYTGAIQHILERYNPFRKNLQSLLAESPLYNDIQVHQRDRSGAFELDEAGKGWLLRRCEDGLSRRICWLPHQRRDQGMILACSGQRIVIGAQNGLLTILDLSNT